MKKVFIIASVALVSLASCKKDRTCTCTTVSGGNTHVVATKMHKVKKGDAREACSLQGSITTTTDSGSGYNVSSTSDDTTCELK